VVLDLKGTDKVDLRCLFDQLPSLPAIDTTLQTRLGILTPDMDRAMDALRNDDDDEFDLALNKVVPEVDSIDRRIELARAVITLRDQGRIPPKLAATALIELDCNESTLFHSSVAESLRVLAGDHRTPQGLIVATR
jgi:hypothetical protein